MGRLLGRFLGRRIVNQGFTRGLFHDGTGWLRSLGFDFLLDRLGVMMPSCPSSKQIASPSIAPVMYDIAVNSTVIQRIACRTWGESS
jgi:hypothetical protein